MYLNFFLTIKKVLEKVLLLTMTSTNKYLFDTRLYYDLIDVLKLIIRLYKHKIFII